MEDSGITLDPSYHDKFVVAVPRNVFQCKGTFIPSTEKMTTTTSATTTTNHKSQVRAILLLILGMLILVKLQSYN